MTIEAGRRKSCRKSDASWGVIVTRAATEPAREHPCWADNVSSVATGAPGGYCWCACRGSRQACSVVRSGGSLHDQSATGYHRRQDQAVG